MSSISSELLRAGNSESHISAFAAGECRWPHYEADEIAAATAVLESGQVNQWTGEQVVAFGDEFAAYCTSRHGIAVSNGTVALELALLALDIGSGDEVLVTNRSFFASAAAVSFVGATPVFCDVDETTQNVTAATLRSNLTERTKAIVCVHLGGWPCEMDDIMALARQHGLRVIEDCAQAHGATYRGHRVGSIGDIGTFSFCQDKILSTGGEGGFLTTNSDELYERMWSLKDHGKDPRLAKRGSTAPFKSQSFRWVHSSIGTNARMTEFQASIGRLQLRKLDGWIRKRRANASLISAALEPFSSRVRLPIAPAYIEHVYYKYCCFVPADAFNAGWNRDRLLTELEACGAPAYFGTCPEMSSEKAFQQLAAAATTPISRRMGDEGLMFLVHPTITDQAAAWYADIIAAVFKLAIKN